MTATVIPLATNPQRFAIRIGDEIYYENGIPKTFGTESEANAKMHELAGEAERAQTRFDEFDEETHPFNKWWKEHGQYMMSGGGRRESIWAARGWIAREQLSEGVEVTGESMHETPPVASAEPYSKSVLQAANDRCNTLERLLGEKERQLNEMRAALSPAQAVAGDLKSLEQKALELLLAIQKLKEQEDVKKT